MMVEDSSGLRSRNMKPWRLYGNGGGSDEFPQVNLFAQCADGSVQLPVSMYGTTGSNYYMTPISAMFTTMKHWQVWLKPDLTGGSAGSFRVTIDGVVVEEANGTWKSQDATLAGNHWYQLSISGYFSKSAEGSCPPANLTGNAYEYWDNWYIDDTQARVEIGTSTTNPSNPTYAQCDAPRDPNSFGVVRNVRDHQRQHRIVRQRGGVPVRNRRGRHGIGRTGHHDQQLAEDSPVNFDMTLRLDFLLVAASVLFFVARLQSKVDGLSSAVERITKMLSDVEIRVRNTELDVAEHMGESKSAKGARGL
jgi:hypothetical protein